MLRMYPPRIRIETVRAPRLESQFPAQPVPLAGGRTSPPRLRRSHERMRSSHAKLASGAPGPELAPLDTRARLQAAYSQRPSPAIRGLRVDDPANQPFDSASTP